MEPLPQLESCVRASFEKGDARHPSGISLPSYFVRAATRGRRRSQPDTGLLFGAELRARLGPSAHEAIRLATDPSAFRVCAAPRATVPLATREWLADGALELGRAEGFEVTWALLGASSELESVAQRLLGNRTPRAVVRQVLHGVLPRGLRAEPFAALLVRVLKIAQSIYAAFRHAGASHDEAWAAVEDRLWSPHPTGQRLASGAELRGAYLPSLVQAASGNGRRRLRRNVEAGRTQKHSSAFLARFASGAGARLWPWTDGDGRLLPHGEAKLTPELAGLAFFVLLTHTASERRSRGGPSGGLSAPFADAGFGASEWLPDRTDDLAVRLLTAEIRGQFTTDVGNCPRIPSGAMLDAMSLLLRGTLASRGAGDVSLAMQRLGVDLAQADAPATLERAREKLPALLRWLEENGRELLETT
jgi:hypothetical protein